MNANATALGSVILYKPDYSSPREHWHQERLWRNYCHAITQASHHRPPPPKYGTRRPIPKNANRGPRR